MRKLSNVKAGERVVLTVEGNSHHFATVSKITDCVIFIGPLRFRRSDGTGYGSGAVRNSAYSIRVPRKGEVAKLEAAKKKQLEDSRKDIDPAKILACNLRRLIGSLTVSQLASLGVERLEMMIGFCGRARIGANNGKT